MCMQNIRGSEPPERYICSYVIIFSVPSQREGIIIYKRTFSFIQHKNPKLTCNMDVTFQKDDLTLEVLSFKNPQLIYSRSFKMKQQQTYREFKFLHWMDDLLNVGCMKVSCWMNERYRMNPLSSMEWNCRL